MFVGLWDGLFTPLLRKGDDALVNTLSGDPEFKDRLFSPRLKGCHKNWMRGALY